MRILVTNDDGKDSPLFPPLLGSLNAWGNTSELRFVVPATERSWVSQAATRFDEVSVSKHEVIWKEHRIFGYKCSGTPADCSSLGIHNLYPEKPDLLLSGINVGGNAGLTFYLFSGTVGAARTGFLSGVNSIALSVDLPSEVFNAVQHDRLAAAQEFSSDWRRICNAVPSCLDRVLGISIFKHADLVNINFPWDVSENSQYLLTGVERNSKGQMFKELSPGIFRHNFQGLGPKGNEQDSLPSDIEALKNSLISVTPISYVFGRDISKDVATNLSSELNR